MVFSPYRLFCFLLLNRLESPLQASFTYNETAAAWKVSIHDSLRHKYTVFSTRICTLNRSASVKPIRKAATSHAKQKRQGFHPYRLTFIFSQSRRHDCRRAFSLPESVHRIAPPASSLSGKLLHLTQNKSGRTSTIPLDVYLFPTQTARLPQGVFSTRICASNRSANADNSNLANLSGKLLHPQKAKRYSFHPYRLMFIFCQRRRHDCHMAFSLPESVHRIAPPMRTHEK